MKMRDVADAVVALVNEISKLMEEAKKTPMEEAGEDAAQDSLLEL